MPATNYLKNNILDATLRGGTLHVNNVWVALFTTATDDNGGGTEVSGNGYARVDAGTVFDTPSAGTINNVDPITFPTPTGSWGEITNWAIYDDDVGGNMLLHGTLNSSKAIEEDDIVSFYATDFVININ